jgi:hypothetical protein
MGHNGSSHGVLTLPAYPHQEFQELCALSTSGELTAEEWARLTEHLSHCDSCREAKRQYERLIATTIPAFGAESSADEGGEDAPGFWSVEEAEATLMETLRREPAPPPTRPVAHPVYRPVSPGWKRVFVFAAAAAILTACSLAGYRIGEHNGAIRRTRLRRLGQLHRNSSRARIPR